ncbi:MAG: D-alanyl-D-alanine carboxypeptidase/D-alanyl-D-alanine-endopeptidase [Polyangiaceae bacterium]|nr:D-alanyl-D-alanine carboxypeptidase/D-alanyl-D-alanine-endopeptidase [Polyangiaceae bacterium]
MRSRQAIPLFIAGVLFALAWIGLPIARSQPSANPLQPTPTASSVGAQQTSKQTPPKTESRAQRAVDNLAKSIAGLGGTLGACVVDLDSGQVIASHNPTTPLNPASNMKLVTAAAALWKLSPNHTYRTALYGRRDGDSVFDLVLRGYGDPSLSARDLWELANGVRRWGITRVKGDIVVDQSFFDSEYIPPGFEQQPDEWAYFRAPVSAIALDANTVTMHVAPSRSGDPALITFAPSGFVDSAGRVMTGKAGSPQNVTLSLIPTDGRLKARVGGAIPEDAQRLRVTRRVDDPTLYAGHVLRGILEQNGVKVAGTVRTGGDKANNVIAMHRSERLANLLERLGKDSDNFYAEMIFKGLASGGNRRGLSTESGVEVAKGYLESISALDEGIVLVNGSGLFDTNRLTARSLAILLRSVYQNPELNAEFMRHLAVGGEDGTLRSRFREKSVKGKVRAKTGTLASVTSLSGYLITGKSRIGFSIIVNGVAGKVPGARDAIDGCVRDMSSM